MDNDELRRMARRLSGEVDQLVSELHARKSHPSADELEGLASQLRLISEDHEIPEGITAN